MPTVRAKEPFAFPGGDGYLQNVAAGSLFDSEDPCVKKRPHLFEAVEVAAARRSAATETASASPGESRFRGKTRPKAETPKSEETGS